VPGCSKSAPRFPDGRDARFGSKYLHLATRALALCPVPRFSVSPLRLSATHAVAPRGCPVPGSRLPLLPSASFRLPSGRFVASPFRFLFIRVPSGCSALSRLPILLSPLCVPWSPVSSAHWKLVIGHLIEISHEIVVPYPHTNSRPTCPTMCFFCTFRPEGTILPARHPGNPASFACLAMLVTYEILKPSVIYPYLSVFPAARSCDPGMTFAFHGQRRSRISFRRESIGRRQVLKQFVEQPHL